MRNKIFIYVLALIIISCNLGNENSKLSGNSFFRNEGNGKRMIASDNILIHKTTIYPDVIDYVYDKNFIIAKQIPNKSNWIPLLGFDLYIRYIGYLHCIQDSQNFEKNRYWNQRDKIEYDKANYKIFLKRDVSDQNSSKDIQISQAIADSLIENDFSYQKVFMHDTNYWIIYNVMDTLIGPLTKTEYLIKRKDLKIPKDLQLKE